MLDNITFDIFNLYNQNHIKKSDIEKEIILKLNKKVRKCSYKKKNKVKYI